MVLRKTQPQVERPFKTPAVYVTGTLGAPLAAIAALEVPLGVAMSFVLVTSAAGAVAEFAAQDAGIAAAIFNSVRQVGTSLGVAIPAAVYDVVTGGSMQGTSVIEGSRWGMLVTAGAFVVTTVVAAVLLRSRRTPTPHTLATTHDAALSG